MARLMYPRLLQQEAKSLWLQVATTHVRYLQQEQ